MWIADPTADTFEEERAFSLIVFIAPACNRKVLFRFLTTRLDLLAFAIISHNVCNTQVGCFQWHMFSWGDLILMGITETCPGECPVMQIIRCGQTVATF